ncbi:MAG: hypothetical protein NVS9B9_16100 [Ktedonobacteraceae bacterium]
MTSIAPTYTASAQEHATFSIKQPRRRIAQLLIFLLISIVCYTLLALVAPQLDQPIGPFMLVWSACFLCYLAVCLWVLASMPAAGRWLWGEMALIFVGAIVFRAMLVHLPLGLSRDAWRYLWDARVIAHGSSPYQFAPFDKALIPLRDSVFANTPYRELPTKYPPGAELFYVLGYLLTPTNLVGLKSLFVVCDLITCAALTALLIQRGKDPRYVIIYAGCPLPIGEFAIQGHVEVLTISCTVLAVLCATSSRQGIRIMAGIFLGLATLTKLYPLILLLVLLRRRDWPLLIACAITIVLGYVPFFVLGHGQILAGSPFTAVVGQRESHVAVIQNVLYITGFTFHINGTLMQVFVRSIEILIVGMTLLVVLLGRLRRKMSTETGILLLTGVILTIYAHIFPWYVPALVPWIVLTIDPLWTKQGLSAKGLAIVMVWYFTFTCISSYIPGLKQYEAVSNWLLYYALTFGVVFVGLAIAALLALRKRRYAFT